MDRIRYRSASLVNNRVVIGRGSSEVSDFEFCCICGFTLGVRAKVCPSDGLVCGEYVCSLGYDDGVCRARLKIGSYGVCDRYVGRVVERCDK